MTFLRTEICPEKRDNYADERITDKRREYKISAEIEALKCLFPALMWHI